MLDHSVMPIVRVAVLATGDDGARLTDVALPAELPLREILPAVARMVLGSETTIETIRPAELSLAPIGGAPFSLDATLDTVGVVDGDLLALQPLPAGPPAPRIIEDIADAAVIFSTARHRPWGAGQIRRGALLAVVGLVLAVTAVSVTHRIATGELVGLLAASGVAVATVLAALLARVRSPLATALAVTALAPVAAAFALAVPGDLGAAQLVLAAAGVTAWSVIATTITDRATALFTATAATGICVVAVAAAAAVWQLPATMIGSALILLGLLVTVSAAQLSASCARFPLPAIPAPGDPTPSAQPLRVLEDLPRRVRASQRHQTGFVAAGVLLGVAGSLVLAGSPDVSPWAWYLVVAAAAGAALRARVWDSVPCKAWLLGHSYLVATALTVMFLVVGRYSAAWWSLAALTALAAVWVLIALNPRIGEPQTYSLPARRLVGFAAAGLDASMLPVMAYLVGLFSWVLNR